MRGTNEWFDDGFDESRAVLFRFDDRIDALAPFDRFIGHDVAGALILGQVEHHVEHYFLDNRTQSAGAGVFFQGAAGDCFEGWLAEAQLGVSIENSFWY